MASRLNLIVLLLFSCFRINAQQLKKVKNQYGGGGATEVFYIDKKEKTKEGAYHLASSRGNALIRGYYSSGRKDSIWTYYSHSGQIVSKHYYKKGTKIATWEFYNDNGLNWTYNFDSSKANYFQPEDTAFNNRTYLSYKDELGNWIFHPPEKHALPLSSENTYILFANLNYPEDALRGNQQGQPNIAVLIDEQGNPISYEIGISSGYHLLDAEALRVIKLLPLEYIPAYNNGIKVKSLVLFPVNFKMGN